MRFLLDTHVLLWASGVPHRRSKPFLELLGDPGVTRVFSVVSIWEVAIKSELRRDGIVANPHQLLRGLAARAYTELPVTGAHAAAVANLGSTGIHSTAS